MDWSRLRPRNWQVTEMLQSKLQDSGRSRRWQQALVPAGQAFLETALGTQQQPPAEAPKADYTPILIGGAAIAAILLLANRK
jgi:hypothetical protein